MPDSDLMFCRVVEFTNLIFTGFSLAAHLAPHQQRLRQAGDDLDIRTHAFDIHPTAPALSLQTGADKGTIRLGEPACGIFMVRVAAEDYGEMRHGLFDLPNQ